ncbi:MAG: DHH family phosphoesterase [Candidatus Pacearchaeota archaeon]|nr:DHH family phosphoesterase [Candidatus Pacearchaeota archaeon]
MGENILESIRRNVAEFLEKSKDKEIFIVSHFDTDGITSASIMISALKRLDKKFSVKIVKSLDKDVIDSLPKDKVILFLDLASSSLDYINEKGLSEVFVIDHHQISFVPEGMYVINSELFDGERISASGLVYLFCKEIDEKNVEFAKLAVLGMIGDRLDSEIDKLNHGILSDGEIQKKRGLLIYPSTRPLNRTLEFCSNPYIPNVTGNIKGVFELLRESGLGLVNGNYPSIIDLNEEEMQRLVTSIILRDSSINEDDILGDIFLIKLFNKLEDAREVSAIVNACSRFGESGVALQFCMENSSARKKAESIHAKYKQGLVSGIKFAKNCEKVKGQGYVIINGRDEIKDVMAGTVASIMASSQQYEEGTVVVVLSYIEDKIKVSLRVVGNTGRNLHELLEPIVDVVGGEVGGHMSAAGCIISIEKEKEFVELLKKNLEAEIVKV